jgi:hypothetical protein
LHCATAHSCAQPSRHGRKVELYVGTLCYCSPVHPHVSATLVTDTVFDLFTFLPAFLLYLIFYLCPVSLIVSYLLNCGVCLTCLYSIYIYIFHLSVVFLPFHIFLLRVSYCLVVILMFLSSLSFFVFRFSPTITPLISLLGDRGSVVG